MPIELDNEENIEPAMHYRDENWDNIEMNNIMDHYATIWFDHYLKEVNRGDALKTVPTAYQNRLVIEHLPVSE